MTLHAAVVRRILKGGDVKDTAADVIAIVQSDPSAAARALRYVNSPAQQDAARRNGKRGGRPRKWCGCKRPQFSRMYECIKCGCLNDRSEPLCWACKSPLDICQNCELPKNPRGG